MLMHNIKNIYAHVLIIINKVEHYHIDNDIDITISIIIHIFMKN